MNSFAATVYVIDDDEQTRDSLGGMLGIAGYLVKHFRNAEDFLSMWQGDPEPGVAIVDACLPGISGEQLHSILLQSGIPVAMIFMTGYGDILASVNAIKQGAIDYLEKPINSGHLLKSLEEAVQLIQHRIEKTVLLQNHETRYNKLTAREKEVCELAARGLLNKQIAGKLGIAEKTVKIHRGRVMQKLELSTIAHLVQFYLQFNPPQLFDLTEEDAKQDARETPEKTE